MARVCIPSVGIFDRFVRPSIAGGSEVVEYQRVAFNATGLFATAMHRLVLGAMFVAGAAFGVLLELCIFYVS